MKLSAILLVLFTLQTLAMETYAQKARLSLELGEASINQILDEIESQSDFYFLFNHNLVDTERKVNIRVSDEGIDQILDQLFFDTNIDYLVMDKQIILSPREYLADTKATLSNQKEAKQDRTITGTVKDENGEAILGATVVVEGSNIGTTTTADGSFTLEIPEVAEALHVSFVGMVTMIIPIGDQTEFEIVLEEEAIEIAEVVAIGYGVQRKSNVTGAIASADADELQNRSTSNVGKALQGKVSGVQILNLSGAPGSNPVFRVRGYSNNGSSDPLYIVDGLEVSDIGYLDPNNIASVEVLKDAASAAIYGAEAGNGVVLISTRSGSPGSSRFFYNALFTHQSQVNEMEMMNASQFKDYWMKAGQPAEAFQNGDSDWNSLMFENGLRQSHTLGFEGGNERASFYAAVSYNGDDGMVTGSNDTYERLAAQINASYRVNDWLMVGTTNSIERAKIVNVSESRVTSEGTAIGGAYFYDPTVPLYYENDADAPPALGLVEAEAEGYNVLRNDEGQLYGSSLLLQSDLWNPYGMIENFTHESWRSNLNGTIYGNVTPFKGFTYTSRVGYRFGNRFSSDYTDAHYWNHNQATTNGALESELLHNVYVQWENFINYSFSLGSNNFTALAGMRFSNDNITNVSATTSRLQNDAANYRYMDYSAADATDEVGGNNINAREISYFGRLEWNYDNKYMLQGSLRADAFDASKLSAENRWGYFPSASAGWVLTNEDFMKNLGFNALSHFKLRASWGINGNVNVLSNYPYTTSLTLGSSYYNYYNQLITGAAPSEQLTNEDLTWEKSIQTNFGFDSRFFHNRLTFSMDYYKKITDGLLAIGPAPAISGTSTVMRNIGEIENSGLEFELSWKGEIGDFQYGISGNLATLHNEVLDSPYGDGRFPGGGGFLTDATYFEKGYPIWYIRTYIIDHIDETSGQPVYKTAEELGTDDGKDFVGSGIPDITYGVTVNAAFKNFDLRIFGSGQQGSELFFGLLRFDLPVMNLPTFVYEDHWTPENTDGTNPSPTVFQAGARNYAESDAWVFNSSYFKIKEIQLGYNLPSRLINRLSISSLRIFASLENFFIFTKYPGIDPESMAGVQNGETITIPGGPTLSLGGGLGVDRVQYPSMKQVLFGINVSF